MNAATTRAPLPATVDGLPAVDPEFSRTLDGDVDQLGIVLTPGQRQAIEDHARLLLAWNSAINLTALRRPEQIARDHVVDSLTALPLLLDAGRTAAGARRGGPGGAIATLLDLGSGGGYPGLPLGLVAGVGTVGLVESIGKKARFLDVAGAAAVAALQAACEPAPRVRALAARAETLAGQPEHRERWDVVTARAVGPLADLVELALPLLRVGGRLIAWKRHAGLAEEQGTARVRLRALRSEPHALEVHHVALPALADHRLVVITKTAQTPARFPRSVAERRRGDPA